MKDFDFASVIKIIPGCTSLLRTKYDICLRSILNYIFFLTLGMGCRRAVKQNLEKPPYRPSMVLALNLPLMIRQCTNSNQFTITVSPTKILKKTTYFRSSDFPSKK